ncbi:MAG TPA: alpha/beta fold hydrolase [Candidatus Moranbacteria bacterium]|jgi:carboxylesterase|nr:alpha/beta fold hydrolase [Candidatus Moranbacteria bacterium]HPX94055.1 alpha/beta fold hydrolase [Candidatus Moranbacteria bacterium]HQB59777.1 alpha/beta fold hydrolase [Candidatus Moranbacteria bacterium]
MVKRILKKAKNIFFANPELLYREERQFVNKPFYFEGANGKAALLLHGWTCTPYEVRRLGKYLNERGYTVSGIQFSGHGTVPKDLEGIKWQTWVDDALRGYDELKANHEKVYIVGTSIGANVAMVLAKEKPDISAIVLMAAPYKLKLESLVVAFAKFLSLFGNIYNKKFYPPTFGSAATVTRLISYQTYPIISALEAFDLIKQSRKGLEKIEHPCFILQSTHDHIVTKDSMEIIYSSISSKKKKKQYIEKAYHTFISDIKNEHVFKDIFDFLEEN